jgi:hypothetical protein
MESGAAERAGKAAPGRDSPPPRRPGRLRTRVGGTSLEKGVQRFVRHADLEAKRAEPGGTNSVRGGFTERGKRKIGAHLHVFAEEGSSGRTEISSSVRAKQVYKTHGLFAISTNREQAPADQLKCAGDPV